MTLLLFVFHFFVLLTCFYTFICFCFVHHPLTQPLPRHTIIIVFVCLFTRKNTDVDNISTLHLLLWAAFCSLAIYNVWVIFVAFIRCLFHFFVSKQMEQCTKWIHMWRQHTRKWKHIDCSNLEVNLPYVFFFLFDAQYKYWIICSWFRLHLYFL